jgi:hypothetical protein
LDRPLVSPDGFSGAAVFGDCGQVVAVLAQRPARIDAYKDLADRLRTARNAIDDDQAADCPLVYMVGHGRGSSMADLLLGNVVFQIKSYSYTTALADSQSTWAFDQCLSGVPVSLGASRDVEHGVPWNVLPYYASRPFAPRACCGMSVPTREELVAAQRRKEIRALVVDIMNPLLRDFFFQREPSEIVPPLVVTIQDKQLAQDYWAGLRRLVNVVLIVVGRMVAMLLASLSRLAQAPPFLLVLLAVVRHYGRRGESDDHFMLTPRVKPMRPRGAACLAT